MSQKNNETIRNIWYNKGDTRIDVPTPNVVLPQEWLDVLGLGPSNREVELYFDRERGRIIIQPVDRG